MTEISDYTYLKLDYTFDLGAKDWGPLVFYLKKKKLYQKQFYSPLRLTLFVYRKPRSSSAASLRSRSNTTEDHTTGFREENELKSNLQNGGIPTVVSLPKSPDKAKTLPLNMDIMVSRGKFESFVVKRIVEKHCGIIAIIATLQQKNSGIIRNHLMSILLSHSSLI